MKPSPSVAPTQLVVQLQNDTHRKKTLQKLEQGGVNPGYFRCASHSGGQESLKQASLFCIHQTGEVTPDFSKVFQNCSDRAGNGNRGCIAAPLLTPWTILFLPPPPWESLQPLGAGSQHPRRWAQQTLASALPRTELQVALPATLPKEPSLHWHLYLPWKYICYRSLSSSPSSASLSLLYSALNRHRGVFPLPSGRFEIGLSNL